MNSGRRTIAAAFAELQSAQEDLRRIQMSYAIVERSRFSRLRTLWFLFKATLGLASPNDRFLASSAAPLPPPSAHTGPQEIFAVRTEDPRVQSPEEQARKWQGLVQAFDAHSALLSAPDPDVTLIIAAYNQAKMTEECLESFAHTLDPGLTVQLILIDDASPEQPIAELFSKIPNITVMRNSKNLGFLRSCNRAAEAAAGRYIHFLNNDTILTRGWLRALVSCAETSPKIGAVGSKLIYPDGSLQEAGGLIWRDGNGWNYGRGDRADDPRYNYVREVDYCSGASLLVRTDLFRGVGGFNDVYAPAYFEDSDLCFALRERGYRVMYQPKSVVIHREGASSGTSTESGVKRYQVVNKPKFIDRWREELSDHCEHRAELAMRAARRLQGKRTLVVIDNYVPEYDKDSGSNKLFNLIQQFLQLGFAITYVPDNYHRSEPYSSTFQNMGVEILYHTDAQVPLEKLLRERLELADLVWIGRPELCKKYLPIVREYPRIPVIYDTHDLHYVRMRRELELKKIEDRSKWRAWEDARDLELSIIRSVDVAVTVSEPEKRTLEDEGVSDVFVVPNVHEVFERVHPFERTAGIVFIGGYNHDPNVDAAQWLCAEIMPRVWDRLPDVKLMLLGSNPPSSVLQLAGDRVVVPGYVADVGPYFEQARVFVAPLRYGAGLKGKVGQAFAYRVPSVMTEIGAEGFDLRPGIDALVLEDARDFANAIVNVYQNPKLWETLSRNCAAAIARYSPQATKTRLDALVKAAFEVHEKRRLIPAGHR